MTDYNTNITVELLSMFRWMQSGWQSPVSLLSPDATITLNTREYMEANKWHVTFEHVSSVFHNELADTVLGSELEKAIVDATINRCTKDVRIIQFFGDSLRRSAVKRTKVQSNMFYPTNFRVSYTHPYRFIIALDGNSERLDGMYMVPSYLAAPSGTYSDDQFYKMFCYEKFSHGIEESDQ